MRKGSCASHFRDVSNFFKVNLRKSILQTDTLYTKLLLLVVVVVKEWLGGQE